VNLYRKTRYFFAENPTQYKSEFILLFCAIVWGVSFPTVKLSLIYMSPNAFIFLRFFVTLAVFYIFYREKISRFGKKEVTHGIILGIYLFIGFISQTVGLLYTSASNSAFITGTNLILIPFVQLIVIKVKPKIENIIGVIIVMTGIYILSDLQKTSINWGDIVTMFCAVAFAFHIVYLHKYSKESPALPLIYGQYLSMTVLSFISMIIFEVLIFGNIKFVYSNVLLFSVIFNGVFSTFIAFILAIKFQKYTTPIRAGLIYNMEQVFAVIFSFIIISEVLTLNQVIGSLIILAGLLVSEFYSVVKMKLTG
jgi:drug/metabolite transporter (DMT)-like permease